MNTYHKIQTVFKRDPKNKFKTLLMWEYSMPEFEYLRDCKWVYTEKVDGTNIRVMWNNPDTDIPLEFRGKTDRADLQPVLKSALPELFSIEKMESVFGDDPVCLYGEGYGPKIQKGGKYRDDASFVLFDVKIGHWWLRRDDVSKIAIDLDIDVVPIHGIGTLSRMVGEVQKGIKSTWGDFVAEGLVARPEVELKARNGSRIITKLKYKDFETSSK